MGNCVGGSKGAKKDSKKLTDEEIMLLMDNTKLTKPQILALHRNFLKECPSGKLTKKDFVKLFKEVHPSENKKEKADKFCEYVFKVIDKQKLGYISFQEFVLCFILTSDGDFKDKCEFAFQLYDLDKDNKISKKEMTQVLTALYDLSGITDRKGNAAPQKKVEDIIRKINAEHKSEEVLEPETSKKKSKASKSGATKGPEYITKEQFIAACNADEQIKQLFVDSIFCGGNDASLTFNMPEVKIDCDDLQICTPCVTINTQSSVCIVDHQSTDNNVNLSADQPEVSVQVNSSASASPCVELNVEAPSVKLNVEESTGATTLEVKSGISDANLNTTLPSVDVTVEAPNSAELNLKSEDQPKENEKNKEAESAN